MPKILSIGGIAALLVTAGLYALAQQAGPTMQLPVQTQAPAVKCTTPTEPQPQLPFLFKSFTGKLCYQDDSRTVEGVYIGLNEVKKAVQPLGFVLSVGDGRVNFYYKPMQKQVAQSYIYFKKDGESYLDAGGDLLPMIMSGFPVPTHLHGYAQPTISVGNLSNIALSSATPDLGEKLYGTVAQVAAYNLFDLSMQGKYKQFGPEYLKPDSSIAARTIQTGFGAGEVVAVYRWVSAASKTHGDTTYMASQITLEVGVTDAQGQVSLHLPDDAKFMTTPSAAPSDEYLLLKLTHTPLQKLKSGIFLPKP